MANEIKLDKSVFGVEVKNHELLKVAYEAYLAEKRGATATTLERGDVRGGGKKPWRQKGTGRARFGSSRNPIWRGGGVVFGPSGNENYTKRIAKNAKHVALRQALTLANKDKKIIVADVKVDGKTKSAAEFLKKNGASRRILIVAEKTNERIRSFRNIPECDIISPKYLTVFEVLNADYIIFDIKALEITTEWLKPRAKKNAKGDK
jgi:large subunit ribosomal protein L4